MPLAGWMLASCSLSGLLIVLLAIDEVVAINRLLLLTVRATRDKSLPWLEELLVNQFFQFQLLFCPQNIDPELYSGSPVHLLTDHLIQATKYENYLV